MNRGIGLIGTVASIVGAVVGIGIFILPGQLAASAGPAVVLSYAMAAVIAAFACTVAAQIGSVFPVSGASFVAVSRTISPMFGFLIVWMMLGAIVLGIALLALGFADYLAFFVPWINRAGTAIGVILLLGGVNLFGVRSTVAVQVLLVGLITIALALYGITGVIHSQPQLFTPFLPNGFQSVLLATIPAFFSFAAFAVVIEVAGDIKNPNRTIPLAFLISFLLVTALYLSVVIATVGNIPWQQLGSVPAPVGNIATKLMSAGIAKGIMLVALAGAASPINALVLSYSRDVMVLAQVGALPVYFGRVSRARNVPYIAVLCIVAAAVAIIPLSGELAEIATLSTLSILVLQLALAFAVLRLPRAMPREFQLAKFRLAQFPRMIFGWGLAAMSALFLLIAAWQRPYLFLIGASLFSFGAVYYKFRKRYLRSRGIDFEERMLRSKWEPEHV